MEPIYSNFDGLDISFQCVVAEHVLRTLAGAKKEAQETKNPAVAKIGRNETVVLVAETGSRGGYQYSIDTGLHGATWFISDSRKKDLWNVRVSVHSLTLALYGYSAVKAQVLRFLIDDLGAIGVARKNAIGGSIETPLERISRIDFCIDFKTAGFMPVAEAFIGKGRFKKRVLEKNDTSEVIFSGRNSKYFRIGSMPNRQVVLYDKISDITEKKKNYWWHIWNIKKSEFTGQIWRIEARAGKKELNKWNLRRFADFEKTAGDVISGILRDIKYVIPSATDKNISRWPMADFWQQAIEIAEKKLQSHVSHAQRRMVMEGHRQELSTQFEKSILGQSVSYAALHGMDISELPAVLDRLSESMIGRVKYDPEKFQKKHQKMTDQYAQLKG